MGCTASRLDNEDTVRRCKERRRLMKEAVHSRHHLASAHSEYLRSLQITGSTLTHFAAGEPLSVSDRTPPVFLRNTPNLIPSSDTTSTLPPPTPHPPPPPPFSPSPFPTTPASKLPDILSESTSPASTPAAAAAAAAVKYPRFPAVNSTYATTPSQASSAWDWENFYPPSPPDSDFFDRRKKEQEEEQNRRHHHLHREEEDENEEEEREEVHCSEWGGNYSTTTSSSTKSDGKEEEQEEEGDGEADWRSEEIAARSDFRRSSDTPSHRAPSEIGSSARAMAGKLARRERSEAGSSSAGWSRRDDGSALDELKMVVRHRNLAEIVAAIEEYFINAATAGNAVSDLLEIGRAQFEGSFRQLKKTVYHSNSVLSSLSSTWTSKPPLAIRYRLDTAALEEETGGRKSHASTLERLLAWEKKLYEEVKAREGVKIEHEKKLSTLQRQEYKGRDDSKLDKTKTSIKKLQSLIIVTSQAVSTTSSAIIRVRDDELAQQLVEMCYGVMNMWRLMNQSHEVQYQIVQQVRGLVNNFSAGESTSDLQRLATRDLEAAVSSWHSSFNLLIKHQRDYVRALWAWLKLTHFPVSGDDLRKDHSSDVSVELTTFCDEWKQALDRLPDTVASEAIKSFVSVVHVISTKQVEELKIKKRGESYSRELEKKSTALRVIEKKYYHSYSTVGLGLPGGGPDSNGQVFDVRDPLAEKKSEIAAYRRKVEDEMTRHAKAVEVTRSMTLNNIQTGLPGVFQAMSGFSGLFAKALQEVCRRAGHP